MDKPQPTQECDKNYTQSKKANIGKLFDGIASTYDRFNHVTSMGIDIWWRRVAIRGMKPVTHLLDVAVGTADVALMALRKGKSQHVTGIDLSREMMAIGKTKAERAGFKDQMEFVEGSALEMPFKDDEFEALTCAYGIRNFSDLDKGLEEMHRVLKEGGQLIILEFSYPTNPLIRWCYDFYFSHIMPAIGRMMSNDVSAYTYFMHSVKSFIWGEEMLCHLRNAGFTNATYRTMTFGITTLYTARK